MTATNGNSYEAFLRSKAHANSDAGFRPTFTPDFLFDFQASLVEWAIRKGRAAIFADCGLGKTPMQLVFAENVVRKENKPVLIATPLAVSAQTEQEAEKFGIDAVRSRDGKFSGNRIVITNYERLHYFDPADFAGMVCDESSILKNFDGVTKSAITDFMRKLKYRLLCTATAAPNDYIELGTSSEALGYLGYMDMLGQFFKNDNGTLHSRHSGYDIFAGGKWRFKPHAERPFWRWLCSWARAVRRPSDLGFADGRFILPELVTREHVVSHQAAPEGMLFHPGAITREEQLAERRETIQARCEKAAELVDHENSAAVWCHLNPEADLLEKLIDGAVQVSGSDSDEEKEEKFEAFSSGEARVLITKPKIGAFGLNWQHCAHQTFFPSHSFEQFYQGVRRSWRFGQKKSVTVDIVSGEGEAGVLANLNRKAEAAEKMFTSLVAEMNNELRIQRSQTFIAPVKTPVWM